MSRGDPPVHPYVEEWAEAARVAPRSDAVRRAHAAMTAAVRSSAVAAAAPSAGLRARLLAPLTVRRRLVLSVAGGLAAVAAVLAVGWNAGPGSPLHTVQQVKEDTSLVMAGGTQATTLRLDYAESRLSNAAAGSDLPGNLAEASWLLDTVKAELPTDHADPLWQRWDRDEARLAGLSAAAGTHGSNQASPPSSAGGNEAGGSPSPRGGGNGNADNDHSPSPTPSASPGRSGGGGGGGGGSKGGRPQASGSPSASPAGPSPSGGDGG